MIEFIGFIISLLALLYLFMRQNIPVQHKTHPSSYPNEEEEEEEDPFKAFLKAMEKEVATKESVKHMPPIPPPLPKKKEQPKKPPKLPLEEYRLSSQIEERHLRSSLEDRHIKSKINHHEDLSRTLALSMTSHRGEQGEKSKASRMQLAVKRLANRRDMIIYQEIMDKPKSLRSEGFHP